MPATRSLYLSFILSFAPNLMQTMRFCVIIILSLLFFLSGSSSLFAQAKERVILKNGGDYLESAERDGEKFQKLIGSPSNQVQFVQKDTRIFGDSVYYFKEQNSVEVFGHVKILEGDSITITGEKLFYDGNIKLAQLRGDVVYKDPSMTLYTDFLDYDMPGRLAYYYSGGKLITENSTLTSDKGYYETDRKFASFKDSVILISPEYNLESDTLQYYTVAEIAYTKGPTIVVTSDGTVLKAKEGLEYKTQQKQSVFQVSEIETEDYILKGDELFFDDIKKYYTATTNVEMIAKEDNIIIYGDYGKYWRAEGITKVYGNALMKKEVSRDTLYLAADTLVSIEDSIPANKRILAYNHVKIYKTDLQGKSDSLAYHNLDSILYFYDDPVLWSDENQITADSINIEIINNAVDRMNTKGNSFVVAEDTIKNFNQIKGRDMVAHFGDGQIDKVYVYGNGESIYYALEEDTVMVGMNKIICSNMLIKFKEGQANSISFYTNPDASFFPPHEILEPETRLKGFAWREEERPRKIDVVPFRLLNIAERFSFMREEEQRLEAEEVID